MCKKFERMSNTLMNRALSCSDIGTFMENFTIQFELHVWWVGAFEVDLEDFPVLHWVFNQTTIPSVINDQEEGGLL